MRHFYISRIYIVTLVFTVINVTCGPNYSSNSHNTKSTQAKLYTLTEDEVILWSGPGEQFEKVINEKASEAMHETEYAEVDKSVTVIVEEVNQQWSRIKVIQPDWLTESHVGWVQTKYLVEPSSLPKPKVVAGKLKIFNNINLLRSKLSENGIGRLHDWVSDGLNGYMSITDYYRFGKASVRSGIENNLAYYLESDNDMYIKNLSLVLNINNITEKKQALERLIWLAEKTFLTLDVHSPSGLREAILKTEQFRNENDLFVTQLTLKESKIETWELVISTK
ncbi:hypothetical protein [Chitinophaga sp. LS1]|uniref:hypothetical protein n=1 Tax=Chitinophaga sp. LS1 TaxID=3051176 RepID=UPI002AAB0A34|nr:hypothetical protein [Chitinophaga sp. LS1]WPV65958.1 hypothetical protein QQL36_29595 [Chitinophaga sp. LS1]